MALRVGVCGLGIMGGGFSGNLVKNGFHVTGYDPSPARARKFRLAGGVVAKSNAEVARKSDVVITSVATAAVLDEVGTGVVMGMPLHDVSGGEFQRILLARALFRDPDLLVLDEPSQGIDVNGQAELYQLITRIRDRRGCGVLMVSHDLHLVMAETDQVICLNHHVCCAGHPETVTTDPNYIALFGKQVASTLAVYHHNHDHIHNADGKVVPLAVSDGETAGVNGHPSPEGMDRHG